MPAKKATAAKQPAKKTRAQRGSPRKATDTATTRASPTPRSADKPGEAVTAAAQKKAPTRPAQRRVVATRPTLLGAAQQVLAKSKEPMTSRAIMDEIDRLGLWKSPKGVTPQSTLYAGMLREIAKKGAASRFAKVDRGLFALQTKEEA